MMAALCGHLALAFPFEAAAQSAPPDEFEVRLIPDLLATAGLIGGAFLLQGIKRRWDDDLSCPEDAIDRPSCDPKRVNPIDRWVSGVSVPGASTVSDLLLPTMLLSPLVLAAFDLTASRSSPGEERLGKDALVIAQTYAATYFLTNALKVLVHRLRPFNYSARFEARRHDGDSRLSFPSGHTSMAFAGAATFSTMLAHRYRGQDWAVGAAIGGWAMATGVGVFRVLAGRHFPTDVVAGAALGTLVGLLIPGLHRGQGESAVDGTVPLPTRMLVAIGGRF